MAPIERAASATQVKVAASETRVDFRGDAVQENFAAADEKQAAVSI